MTERVQIGSAVLQRADCLEMLGDLLCDVILTDPVWPNCPPGLLPGSDDPAGLWRRAMCSLPSVARLIAVLRCDSDPRFLSTVPPALPFFRSIQLPYNVPSFIGRVLGGDEPPTGSEVRSKHGRAVRSCPAAHPPCTTLKVREPVIPAAEHRAIWIGS